MTTTFTSSRTPIPLEGASLLSLDVSNLLELGAAVTSGFPTKTLEGFAKHLHMTLGEMLTLLDFSESTYHSYRRNQRPLNSETSAKLYSLARVTEAAEQYFENATEAHTWLLTCRITFGNQTPLQFALLPLGADYVITVLNRLEYGVHV
jgi:putative toxin-antitoxin system antitoxin component (TIGR02293 family)